VLYGVHTPQLSVARHATDVEGGYIRVRLSFNARLIVPMGQKLVLSVRPNLNSSPA
jgi:hypothetical protein